MSNFSSVLCLRLKEIIVLFMRICVSKAPLALRNFVINHEMSVRSLEKCRIFRALSL